LPPVLVKLVVVILVAWICMVTCVVFVRYASVDRIPTGKRPFP
jgi:hypothetical protein